MDGNNRSNIKQGTHVLIVQKQDQRTGNLTEGKVEIKTFKEICEVLGVIHIFPTPDFKYACILE